MTRTGPLCSNLGIKSLTRVRDKSRRWTLDGWRSGPIYAAQQAQGPLEHAFAERVTGFEPVYTALQAAA